MTRIQSVFSGVEQATYGPPVTYRNMAIVPLIAVDNREPDYHTLHEALTAGSIRVAELDHSGSVPELRVVNRGDTGVLLLDGEELVGAKQNRVVNLSILVPAQREVVIPVSCVEAGRWRRTSSAFASSPRAQFAEGRAARMQQVSQSMGRGSRRSDQDAVWSLIAAKSERLGARSRTRAMSAIFEKVDDSIGTFVSELPSAERQAGAVFIVDDRVAGVEWFDCAATWRNLAPKLVRSYALDALDAGRSHRVSAKIDAPAFLAKLTSAEATIVPSVGEGEDVRLTGDSLVGAALFVRGRTIHLTVFPQAC